MKRRQAARILHEERDPNRQSQVREFRWTSLLWDRLAALPIVVFVAFASDGLLRELRQQAGFFSKTPALLGAIEVLCTTTLLIFFVQQAVLCLARVLPVAREQGLLPRVVALASVFCGLLLLLAGRDTLGVARGLLAATLVLLGTIASITALAWLGRSFSIFPQARQLVTSGPYRLIRHPLYFCESIGFLGVCLQFRMPLSLLIYLLSLALMLCRIGYEEDVLLRTFPTYAMYRATTWRLIPFLY